jgi:predicted aspartyl protease
VPLRVRIFSIALAAVATQAGASAASTEPPQIAKPRPAPATSVNLPPLPPAQFDSTLAVGGQDLKAREVSTRLNVDVRVNGRGPYRFVVDSGADTSVVGLRIARELELPMGEPAILNATTSRDVVDRVKVAQLTIGSSNIPDLLLPALRESDVGGDGLIGIDALTEQRLMMDFEAHQVRVEDARKPFKAQPGDIVVTAKRVRGQLILTAVHAGNVSLDAIIDTGSEVTIGNLALRDKLLGRRGTRFWTVQATGVTGVSVPLQMAVISHLQLGPITLQDVPIAFADVPPFKMFGLGDQPALMLGTDLLETFRRISLDFRARKVRFQLRRCGTDGVTISTSPDSSGFTRLSSTNTADVCGR